MNVSPLDLRQQKFNKSFRGFDPVEVTALMMAVAEDYEQALREADRLRTDLTRMEAVLNEHPAVVQSAVIGRAVEGNEEVVAFVELAAGAKATPAELIEWCSARLAPYKRPAEVRVLAALPAASTGKILKHRLRDLL